MRKFVNESLALAEKELKLALRFKFSFFTSGFVQPLLKIVPFALVYYGFFAFGGGQDIGVVTGANFFIFLVLGLIADMFFEMGFSAFTTRFLNEKYWDTIEGILMAPLNKISLISGVGLAELIAFAPALALFFSIVFIIHAVSINIIVFVLCVLLLALFISLSLGLIASCAVLFNENFVPFFSYLRMGLVFISCFYYPIDVLLFETMGYTVDLRILALLNPFYQANFLIKEAWLNPGFVLADGIFPFAYLILFALITPLFAIFMFNKLWRILGIQGY